MTGTDLLDALPVAVYMTDSAGRITFFNEAAAELWGHRPQLNSDQWCGSWRLYWPDGRPLPHDECPMAVALNEGRAVRGVEAIAERPDGSRVRFLPYPTPLRDASGRLTGAINLLIDMTERHTAELVAARLAAIVASSDDAIISKTLDGIITSWNDGATDILGYQAQEMIGQSITRMIPPELQAEEKEILAKLQRGERIRHYETVRIAKDGRRVDMSLTVSPLRDKSGKIIGASKVGRDITQRKQMDKLQRLLIEELNHRVKNTLAMIQAIASQSLRSAKHPGEFVSSFQGRVQALAAAHDLLTQAKLQGAELMALVREQVLLGGGEDHRISCSGPTLMLDPHTAIHLGLVLHELATNARKYGALSVPAGRLAVSWEMRSNGGRQLLLHWEESNGPKVSAPTERGFGTTLIEQTLQSHGGTVFLSYRADGVSAEISLPLPEQIGPSLGTHAAAPKIDAGALLIEPLEDRSPLIDKRIILIEDEPLVAMEMEATLTAAGCELMGCAGTIDAARTLIAQTPCDAALLDVNLAGRPVDELAAALTQNNIPFAFVTGYGREALPRGFRDAVVLTKPFSERQLIAVVELLLYRPAGVVELRQNRQDRRPR